VTTSVIPGLREAKSPEPISAALEDEEPTLVLLSSPTVVMGSGLDPTGRPGMTACFRNLAVEV